MKVKGMIRSCYRIETFCNHEKETKFVPTPDEAGRQKAGEAASVCQLDFHRGTGQRITVSFRRSRRLGDIDNHVLSLGQLSDHIVVDHDAKTVLVDMHDTYDTGWVEMTLLGNLPHQVPYSALSEVDGTVVIWLLVDTGKADIKASNCEIISK